MVNVRYGARTEEGSGRSPVIKTLAKSLWADWETDPEVIAAVLPRPLEPGKDPIVHLNIGAAELGGGNLLGVGNFTVRARHGDVEGEYCLMLPMGTESSVVGGRERWGEPKKITDITLERNGDDVRGTLTRHDITFAEMRGRVVEKLETPPPKETLDFYFKFMISPDGKGFDNDPALVYCRRTYDIESIERVEGEVILRESPFDPVVDLPVRKLLSLTYVQHRSAQRGEIVDRVPGEFIAPFVHQRYDSIAARS
jgi:acetoacetate decarboxylase